MGRALHILHVDDDEEIRQIVALSLSLGTGMRVTGAADVKEALLIGSDPVGGCPDIVLLDYSIGMDDGVALLETMRGLPGLATVTGVFLTGRLREVEQTRMLAAGAKGVLRKPFNPLTLAEEIRALVLR